MGMDHSKFRSYVLIKDHPLNQCGWAEDFGLKALAEWARISGKKSMRAGYFVFDPEMDKMLVQATVGHPSGVGEMFKVMRIKAMDVYQQPGGGDTSLNAHGGRVRKVLYRGPDGQIHTVMVMGDWNPGLTFSPDELRPACTQALIGGLLASGAVKDPTTRDVFSLPDALVARRA